MGDLDERVTNGLRELANRAPLEADVWAGTARYVTKHRRRRQAFAATAVIIVAAVVVTGGVLATSTNSRKGSTITLKQPPLTRAVTPTTVRKPAITTPHTTTTTVSVRPGDACPKQCIGRVRADVDGDGRLDVIGLMATPPDGQLNMKLVVRVVFADGRVAEYRDTAYWKASLLGATDVNGDHKAEIFYIDYEEAHNFAGQILRWDGSNLVATKGSDGKAFLFQVGGDPAVGGSGFQCAGSSFIESYVYFNGTNVNASGPWSGMQTTYRWQGGELVQMSQQPIAFTAPQVDARGRPPAEFDQINGVHCTGLSQTLPNF